MCGLIAVLSFSQAEESTGMCLTFVALNYSCISVIKVSKNAKINTGLEGVNV